MEMEIFRSNYRSNLPPTYKRIVLVLVTVSESTSDIATQEKVPALLAFTEFMTMSLPVTRSMFDWSDTPDTERFTVGRGLPTASQKKVADTPGSEAHVTTSPYTTQLKVLGETNTAGNSGGSEKEIGAQNLLVHDYQTVTCNMHKITYAEHPM